MNLLMLSWRYLWARPLATLLNGLLLSLGLASISFLLVLGQQLDKAFTRDLAGIDLVVGAKGSPLQLILAGVLHIDTPTGNISLGSVRQLAQHPQVASVIPISLGDNLRGFRIVGTSQAYPDLYGATLAQGRWWDAPMEAVLGASVARTLGLAVGDRFAGSHGLASGGPSHGAAYRVVGVLAPTGSVLDRLVLTDSASVWHLHAAAGAEDPNDHDGHDGHDGHGDHDSHADEHAPDTREVTLALIRYRSPLAAVSFPRYVNSQTALQAAAPALEISRLLRMLGLGTDVLRAFGAVLLLSAGLSVFVALWSAVRERQGDLALLRMLGASPARVAGLLLCEALWLGTLATLGGLALGQLGLALLAGALQLDPSVGLAAAGWPEPWWVVPGLALLVSVGAALLPAWGAYRVDVRELLQSR